MISFKTRVTSFVIDRQLVDTAVQSGAVTAFLDMQKIGCSLGRRSPPHP
jgi:hypothetical protein